MYKGLSGFRQRNVLTLINSVGYSIAEASFDREANNLDEIRPNLEVFQIPVIYRLDGPELVVTIPCDEIVHHESYRLTSISLLRFFGAADSTQSGYIFVPDGSGALINLNNGKTQMNAWASSIYGSDWALSAVTAVNTENVYLPVFGIKHEDKAMMASSKKVTPWLIKADVSGRGNSFNTVHSEYRVRPVGSVTLDTGTRTAAEQADVSVKAVQRQNHRPLRFSRQTRPAGGMAAITGLPDQQIRPGASLRRRHSVLS